MSSSRHVISLADSVAESSADLSRQNEIDLSALWRVIWKHRAVVVGVALAVIALAFVFLKVAPPQYEAIATLEARPFSPEVKEEDIFGKVITDGSVNVLTEEDISTTAAKLLRHEFLSKVAADKELQRALQPGLAKAARKQPKGKALPLEAAIIEFLKPSVSVEPVKKTRLIDVVARHTDPAIAALIADTFVNVVITDGISSRAAFAGRKIEDLEADFREVNNRMVESQRRIALYTRPEELREALTISRNEVKTLAGRYKDRHPKMIEATEVVSRQEEALAQEFEKIRANPIESAYWLEALGGSKPEEIPRPHIENLLAGRYLFLSSELDALRSLHTSLSVRLNEVRIANNSPDLDLRLFQAAVTPRLDQEVFPNKPLVMAAAIVFGLGLGTVAALLLALLRPRLESLADWQASTSLPLLGMINEFPSPETTPYEMVDATKGFNPLMEQIRNLRIRLGCPHSGSSGTLLITSALPQEGKTSVASALALSMVRGNPGEVVIVDLDLQRPSLHRDLRVANDLGVSDILLGKCSIEDALIETDGLMVLTAGTSAFQAHDRLNSQALASLIRDLKAKFPRVIIDSAPVLPCADTLLIGSLCDEVLLLVNSRSTPVSSFRQAEQDLIAAGANLRAGILNQLPTRNHKASYQYKYLVKAYDQLSRRVVAHASAQR
jgi:uncharacterized protein involved in exopolysaccharide biosynthesis/Mrp family chromosome partitioning ATPase